MDSRGRTGVFQSFRNRLKLHREFFAAGRYRPKRMTQSAALSRAGIGKSVEGVRQDIINASRLATNSGC